MLQIGYSKRDIFRNFMVLLLVTSEIVDYTFFAFVCVLALIFLIMHNKGKLYIKISLYVCILCIVILGIGMGVANLQNERDYIRDIFCVSIPLVYLALSSGMCRELNEYEIIIDVYVDAGIILSVLHIFTFFIIYNMNLMKSRGGIMGFESVVTCVAFFFLLLNLGRKRKLKNFELLVMIISIILYVSRTMMVMMGIVLLCVYFDYFRKNILNMLKISCAILICLMCAFYILPTDVMKYFTEKLANSFVEINANQVWNFTSINHNWRGYERYLILSELKQASLLNQNFGFGFGKLLETHVDIKLGTVAGSIPVFHGGVFYVLYKTGVFGSVFLIAFYIILLHNAAKIPDVKLKRVIKGIVIFSFVQMFLSMGIFSSGAYASIPLLLGWIFTSNTVKSKMSAI